MQRQLNTLYATTDGAWLHQDGANIVLEVEREVRARVPVHMLQSVVCIGRISVSPQLMGFCAEQGITICYLTPSGKFLARVEGPVSGNVLLRREQYRRTDDPSRCSDIVRNILVGKIYNQRAVLARGWRDHGDSLSDAPAFQSSLKRLKRIRQALFDHSAADVLRGHEGEAAQAYFSALPQLIRSTAHAFRFDGRNRRPPRDATNALLSLLYTLLTHDCRSALETVGLDPAVGFLHRDRPGRPSLALDLAEELRSVLADRLALSLINRMQVTERDFRKLDNGAVLLSDEARKTVITAYQERKKEEVLHAFIGEKISIGLIPHIQAQLLARHLRGDLDAYPPLLWK
ncbi:MAG: type I-C CRISPR-associated endonuclease Cas1 [Acidobacteriaceae bacterium]|nr:type I-C CRISPR-associated endonuclease Cas1 [Acidobacteriaceae bacterium]MBV8570356.1 type I-C CRISPR-associated endonuclease Cas1 [Acidobacteriaceae bacterium]